MTLRKLALSSERHARRWTTRLAGPSAGTSLTLRGSEQTARIQINVGDRIVLWQAPSFGSKSTRTRRTRERTRGGRRLTVTARGGRRRTVTAVIRGRLRGARIGTVGTETVATADGRAEKDEVTGEGTTEVVNVIDVRAVKETARGAEAVMETVLPEVTEISISGKRDQSEEIEEISKDCREPQPWARSTTGKRRAQQAAGSLLGVLRPAEPFRPPPEMVMLNPLLKVAIRFQDATSSTRWWSVPLQVKTMKDASLQAASSPMRYWRTCWLAGIVSENKDWNTPPASEGRIR